MDAYTNLRTSRVDLAQAIPLPKPFTLLFEPACMCNFRCSCCFYSQPDIADFLTPGKMHFGDFQKLMRDLEEWEGDAIKVIRFIGFGEPLLHQLTPEMIQLVTQKKLAERVEMTTNGSLLTPEVSARLINAGLDYIRVSVYAATEQRHKETTRGGISACTIKENVAALRKMRDAQGLNKPFIYVKMLEHQDDRENKAFLEAYGDIADEVALEPQHNWLDSPTSGQAQRIACPQPFKMMSIRHNGDVIMCDPDWPGNTYVGNALREGLRQVWTGPQVKAFWELQLQGRREENNSCATCSFINNPGYVLDDIDSLVPKKRNRQ